MRVYVCACACAFACENVFCICTPRAQEQSFGHTTHWPLATRLFNVLSHSPQTTWHNNLQKNNKKSRSKRVMEQHCPCGQFWCLKSLTTNNLTRQITFWCVEPFTTDNLTQQYSKKKKKACSARVMIVHAGIAGVLSHWPHTPWHNKSNKSPINYKKYTPCAKWVTEHWPQGIFDVLSHW